MDVFGGVWHSWMSSSISSSSYNPFSGHREIDLIRLDAYRVRSIYLVGYIESLRIFLFGESLYVNVYERARCHIREATLNPSTSASRIIGRYVSLVFSLHVMTIPGRLADKLSAALSALTQVSHLDHLDRRMVGGIL